MWQWEDVCGVAKSVGDVDMDGCWKIHKTGVWTEITGRVAEQGVESHNTIYVEADEASSKHKEFQNPLF